MNFVPLVMYIVASIAYAVYFAQRSDSAGRCSTLMLVGASLTHTFVIGMHTMQVGHIPVVGTTGSFSVLV